MNKKTLIFGAGETATIAAEFFIVDSHEKIAGFVVDDHLKNKDTHHGFPLYKLTEAIDKFSPSKYKIFVALSYGQLNRERLRMFTFFNSLGYEFVTYISSNANVWRTAEIGKNCMIFEGNNLQHNSLVEDNVILWSGNHLGHGSRICQSAYLSSHVCVAGFSSIGERAFLGINSSIIDEISVAEDCFIAAGAVVNKNTLSNGVYIGNPAIKNQNVTATKLFKVKNETF